MSIKRKRIFVLFFSGNIIVYSLNLSTSVFLSVFLFKNRWINSKVKNKAKGNSKISFTNPFLFLFPPYSFHKSRFQSTAQRNVVWWETSVLCFQVKRDFTSVDNESKPVLLILVTRFISCLWWLIIKKLFMLSNQSLRLYIYLWHWPFDHSIFVEKW